MGILLRAGALLLHSTLYFGGQYCAVFHQSPHKLPSRWLVTNGLFRLRGCFLSSSDQQWDLLMVRRRELLFIANLEG